MAVTLQSLGIDRLNVGERLNLIEQIWDSLPESVEPTDVPGWHLAELSFRRTEVADRPGEGLAWREVIEPLVENP